MEVVCFGKAYALEIPVPARLCELLDVIGAEVLVSALREWKLMVSVQFSGKECAGFPVGPRRTSTSIGNPLPVKLCCIRHSNSGPGTAMMEFNLPVSGARHFFHVRVPPCGLRNQDVSEHCVTGITPTQACICIYPYSGLANPFEDFAHLPGDTSPHRTWPAPLGARYSFGPSLA